MNTKEYLFKKLEELNILSQTFTHKPVFTCDEAATIKDQLPSHGQIKNLFLKDKKKRFWLIVVNEPWGIPKRISLKDLAKDLQAPELRFAGPDDLFNHLGVLPGSVTPLGLINDKEQVIHVVLDENLFDHKTIGVHPLSNDATTILTPQDLQKFITACGNQLTIMNLKTI